MAYDVGIADLYAPAERSMGDSIYHDPPSGMNECANDCGGGFRVGGEQENGITAGRFSVRVCDLG